MGSKKSSPIKKASPTSSPSKVKEKNPTTNNGTINPLTNDERSPATEISNPNLITCKHLPFMTEFLNLYNGVRWNHRQIGGPLPFCADCGNWDPPLYACLQCSFIGCWQGSNCHFSNHFSNIGHALGVELISGAVYCCVCKSFVWNDLMSDVWNEKGASSSATVEMWKLLETITLEVDSNPLTKTCTSPKGFYNLGNTCFLNTVLQALIHTKPLRNYFLTASQPPHRPLSCLRVRSRESCIACATDALLMQAYSDSNNPLAISDFLETLWRSNPDMAGYEQQDAHELLVTLRNALHLHLNGSMFNCHCIVHSLFSGVLQSDVTCLQCGNITETLDPFLDISLDIPANSPPLRLIDCLYRFTRAENLSHGNYSCGKCHKSHPEILKQLRLRVCPTILTIHLKRFEHGIASAKIDTRVTFDKVISLSPFCSPNMEGPTTYKLYAVISHVGTMEGGHYTVYIRSRGDWFWIDDACVTLCNLADVHNCGSNAYLLFYELVNYET